MDTVYDHLKGREPELYGRSTKFEGMSTTADAYRQWEIPAPPAPRAARGPGESVPFDGTSSYKLDYPAYDVPPARPAPLAVRLSILRAYPEFLLTGSHLCQSLFSIVGVDHILMCSVLFAALLGERI
jgi:hypothetical protein